MDGRQFREDHVSWSNIQVTPYNAPAGTVWCYANFIYVTLEQRRISFDEKQRCYLCLHSDYHNRDVGRLYWLGEGWNWVEESRLIAETT